MAAGAWRADISYIYIYDQVIWFWHSLRQLEAAKLMRGRDQSISNKQRLAHDHLHAQIPLLSILHILRLIFSLPTSFHDSCP